MKVKNFSKFMRSTRLNEQNGYDDSDMGMYGMYGANPEDDAAADDSDMPEDSDEDAAEEPLTLEDLKAMIDELTERVEALEGGDEGEEGAEEGAEEGDEAAKDANEAWRWRSRR
jgi:hypothetical protein